MLRCVAAAALSLLVVEDDPLVREVAVEVLEDAGYRTLGADGRTHALALVRERHPRLDLLVSDVQLPGGNGFRLLEELRHTYPRLPALFVSGYPDTVLAQRAGMLPTSSVLLHKPYSNRELLAHVGEILARSSGSSSDHALRERSHALHVLTHLRTRELLASAQRLLRLARQLERSRADLQAVITTIRRRHRRPHD
jgi:DNA-binding response OmpR family regulator